MYQKLSMSLRLAARSNPVQHKPRTLSKLTPIDSFARKKRIPGMSSPRCRPCLCTDVAEAY